MTRLCLFLTLLAAGVAAQGTVTTSTAGGDHPHELEAVTFVWAANATGEATATTTRVAGTVERVVFSPNATPEAPTHNYDITLTDPDGFDILETNGGNLASAEATQVELTYATLGISTLSVTNAGASGEGVVRIYVRP